MGFFAIRGKTGKEKVRGKEGNPLREILQLMPPAQPSRKLMEVTLFSLNVPIEEGSGLPLWQAQNISCGSRDIGKNPLRCIEDAFRGSP